MPANNNDTVTIVGGGWAGLSAAVWLSHHNKKVTLYESAKQLGGRARCVPFEKHRVDNGQHLLLGAYRDTLKIMHICGVDPDWAFHRLPLSLKIKSAKGDMCQINTASLPAPFNLIVGILRARCYSLAERVRTIRFLASLRRCNFTLTEDISVQQLFKNQPYKVWLSLWEPLCLAVLNTPAKTASAQIFLNVLRDSFTQKATDADLLIPQTDLTELFVQPAMRYIEKNHGHIHLGQRVTELVVEGEQLQALRCGDNEIRTTTAILATPITATIKLLDQQDDLDAIQTQLSGFSHQPIYTIYLQYDSSVRLQVPMLGLNGLTAQWLFDRRYAGQAGLIAAVISADGPHTRLDTATLAQLVNDELMSLFNWPEAIEMKVLRDKRATFAANVGINKHRPVNTTPVKGLYLAGDYTLGPYPATLEAAVQSGVQCAQLILKQ